MAPKPCAASAMRRASAMLTERRGRGSGGFTAAFMPAPAAGAPPASDGDCGELDFGRLGSTHPALRADPLEHRGDIVRPDRLANVKTLDELALDEPEQRQLLLGLDALGDDCEVHRVAQRDQRLDERIGGRVQADLADIRPVDLQLVERELAEVADRGEAGAEIVERQAEAVFLEDPEL